MQQKKDLYIDKIKFNIENFSNLIKGYLGNIRFALMLVIILLGSGIFSYFTLSRTLNPEVKIPIVSVFTALPGAGPEDIESLITIPLEDEIRGLTGIDAISSSSREGVSSIMIQFLSNVDPDKAKQDVQSTVDSVVNLPKDATTPRVEKLDFENQPIWTFSIVSETDQATLNRFSKQLREDVEDLSKIDHVSVNGLEEQEIQVLIKEEAISQYGINPSALVATIKAQTSSHPVGLVNSDQSSFSLTIDSQVMSVNDIRDINIILSGARYKLSDIAVIAERSKPDQFGAFLARPNSPIEKSVSFNIFKTSDANITQAQSDADELIKAEIEKYGEKFELIDVFSTAKELEIQFDDLFSSFRNTIFLVFLVLLVFFGIRQAIIASLTIPLTFLAALVVMDFSGITLNFLSSFSLLLSLGLLVDVTIVIISAITSFYRSGKFSPYESGLLVWKDYLIALSTTTLTTVWAFIPLLLASGIIGEFIKPIPIVVSSTLISATLIGFFITLPLMVFILKPSFPSRVRIFFRFLFVIFGGVTVFIAVKGSGLLSIIMFAYVAIILFTYSFRIYLTQSARDYFSNSRLISWISKGAGQMMDSGLISMQVVSGYYQSILERIIASKKNRRKVALMVVLFSLFAFSLFPLGFVVNEFFPKEDVNEIYVDIEYPEGTRKSVVQEKSLAILNELKDTQLSETTLLQIGVGFDSQNGPGGVSGSNLALFTINLIDKDDREIGSEEISKNIREKFSNYTDGRLAVNVLSGGPPAGSDVQIKYLGDDLTVLDDLANRTVNYLNGQSGIVNADKSIKSGTAKIVFIPDNAKIAQAGITLSDIGAQMRTFVSGFELDNDINLKNNGKDKYDIILRTNSEMQNADSLGNVVIAVSKGNVPLMALGDLKLASNPTIITREEGKRSISVSAGAAAGFSSTKLNADLANFAQNELNLPSGYEWKTGGANEENQKSVQSILRAMILSFLLILATMVIQFGSFRMAMLVLLVIPLAVSGVFIVFALTGVPLSFPALIGVLALFGIVVNNSIILIDKIKLNLNIGMELNESIIEASVSRLEPIALSSITTIVGLIPVTLSNVLWQGLGGAIIAGLIFSGTIMLFFIPVVYRMWFGKE
ncbi:MAG: Cation/multidrug efflux pump [Candidatus Moranbacteria bacterium GW2011_GWE2_35_2-]|nr:MAG: Cation/multidrug efflux pump [Candidatus Moranbacteria bacterium GW2011_GWE2_35_2-]KKQ29121.1 MAG: Cation/multidrug efflux pump [Candidatus Moranbacteria bacterium GW2011_GWD1_37_17]KKQ31106.1 MAG: Cation/multidrug efflux pump [Candidatus Moranbacteria bacterium GW2011_GWE1_37_24]KKQ47528.1 MAG: Cation/multidrug efflux pump [Candidatus Moranbacteria bacterium GW2011_GWD2_37_9]HBO16496.1 hypothetical protein [Candidatus Moranbacteria bacterium]